jgi:hypothetical protein
LPQTEYVEYDPVITTFARKCQFAWLWEMHTGIEAKRRIVLRKSGGLLNASIQPTPRRSPSFDQASLPFIAIAISNDAIIIGGTARTAHHHQQRTQHSHFAPPALNPSEAVTGCSLLTAEFQQIRKRLRVTRQGKSKPSDGIRT